VPNLSSVKKPDGSTQKSPPRDQGGGGGVCGARKQASASWETNPASFRCLGDLKRRDDALLDLLAGFPSSFARPSVFPPGLIEVGNEFVALDWGRL
jgi:hypothetical protein